MTRRLIAVPAFGDYLTKCTGAILAKRINWKGCPVPCSILARFKLNENGTVSEVEVSGDTNAPVAPVIMKGIKKCSPFSEWPKRMRSVVGKSYLEMYINYGYLDPPGTR